MTFTTTIDVEITPKELAAAFCEMLDDQQAEFFAEVWQIARGWPGAGWCQQSCSIASKLDDAGRECIKVLASHANYEEGDV